MCWQATSPEPSGYLCASSSIAGSLPGLLCGWRIANRQRPPHSVLLINQTRQCHSERSAESHVRERNDTLREILRCAQNDSLDRNFMLFFFVLPVKTSPTCPRMGVSVYWLYKRRRTDMNNHLVRSTLHDERKVKGLGLLALYIVVALLIAFIAPHKDLISLYINVLASLSIIGGALGLLIYLARQMNWPLPAFLQVPEHMRDSGWRLFVLSSVAIAMPLLIIFTRSVLLHQ